MLPNVIRDVLKSDVLAAFPMWSHEINTDKLCTLHLKENQPVIITIIMNKVIIYMYSLDI